METQRTALHKTEKKTFWHLSCLRSAVSYIMFYFVPPEGADMKGASALLQPARVQ